MPSQRDSPGTPSLERGMGQSPIMIIAERYYLGGARRERAPPLGKPIRRIDLLDSPLPSSSDAGEISPPAGGDLGLCHKNPQAFEKD